ncbi:MAG: HAMP domain-containing protein [Deltaproteobacteria bacterium]|nr:HAMP domain-containing protein [Deltaproteobacteria bacterium]
MLQSLLNVGAASRIYIFDAERRSIVDTEPGTPIGTEYFRLAPHAREIRLAFDGVPGDATVFRGLDDQWYKSAFAPVKEGDRVVAVVGVEAGVTFFDTLRVIRRNLVLFGVIAAVLMMAASLLLAVGFERPIARLVQSAQRLAEGDLVTRIESTSHDEIGFLAEALDDARSRIVERDRNLKMLQRGIAHEVRNPLGGMRLFAIFSARSWPTNPKKRPTWRKSAGRCSSSNAW